MNWQFIKNKKIMIVLCIAVVLCVLGICGGIQTIKINNTKIYEQAKQKIYTKKEREEAREALISLLQRGKYLTISDDIKITNQIAKIYLIDGDYEKGLEYSVHTIYLADKIGNNYEQAKALIDMSNVIVDLGGFETAEEIIKYALTLEIKDMERSNEIKSYAYINLADIYSKTKESDKAIEYILKCIQYDVNDEYSHEKEIVPKIILARALFYKGEIAESGKLLTKIEEKIKLYQDALPANTVIPYLGVKAKVQFYKGNFQEAIRSADKLFNLCNKEGLLELKKIHMKYILDVLHTIKDDKYTEKVGEYEHYLLGVYNQLIESKNKSFVYFILSTYKNKIEYFHESDNKVNAIVGFSFIIVLVAIAMGMAVMKIIHVRRERDTDALTKIYNRGKFDLEYKRCINNKESIGLMVIDIDHFKSVNDTYGHSFGDVVLKNVSGAVQNKVSKEDIFFRYGGEEFCILCKNKKLEDTIELAEEVRKEVENIVWNKEVKITISIGIAYTGQAEDLFKLADDNLYKSKETGRNKVTYV